MKIHLLIVVTLIPIVGFGQINNLESSVDTYLSPLLNGNNFSGSILIKQDEEIILDKGYGKANIEGEVDNSSLTKFQIASLSKSFTATAILLLNEKRKLSLDDPIGSFLPELTKFSKVTVHQLLNHTSGIPDINRQNGYQEWMKNPQSPGTLVKIISTFQPAFQPGEKDYSYSNSNYNVLARIIEVTSGLDYGAFLQQEIFDPLQLTNTGHRANMSQEIEGLATGYVPSGGYTSVRNAPYLDWSVKTGNGSLYSTTEDLLKWVTGLLNGEILSKPSLDMMMEQKYGWFIGNKMGRNVMYINGSSPGYNGYLAHFSEKNLSIIVLGNYDIALATFIGEGLAALVLGQEATGFPKLSAMEVDEEFIKSIEGTYKFPWYSFEIRGENNELIYKGSYPYYEVSMIPVTKDKFFNRFFWSYLVIEKDENQQATHVYWEGSPGQKGVRIRD